MQQVIQSKSLTVNNDLEKDLISIMSNANSKDVPAFMKLFREEQQKYLSASPSKSVRYHPMIICPAIYDEIRFDEMDYNE